MQNSKSEYFVYIAVLFFPIQILQIPVRTTNIDLSSIIILFVFLYAFLTSRIKENKSFFIFFCFFVLFYTFIFIYSSAPVPRFISSLIWISLAIYLILGNQLIILNFFTIEKLIKFSMLIAALMCWYQYFFVIGPSNYNLGVKLRSMALFMEPSYAGLALYSTSIAYLSSYLFIEKKNYDLIFAIFYFLTGVLTLAMHVITFFLVLSILVYYFLKLNFSFKLILKFCVVLMIISLFLFFLASVIDIKFIEIFSDHLKKRNIFDLDNASLSLLAWLMGLEQTIASLDKNIIFGFGAGLGSTGEFEFDSISRDKLNLYNAGDLTLKDAYSLLFRLTIEIGFIFTIFFIIYLFLRVVNFFQHINNKKNLNYLFTFVFSLSIIGGSLLKEPNFARSSLIIALTLFCCVPRNFSNVS